MFTASAHGYTHRVTASVLFVYVHCECSWLYAPCSRECPVCLCSPPVPKAIRTVQPWVPCLSMFTASAHGYTHRVAASILFVYVHSQCSWLYAPCSHECPVCLCSQPVLMAIRTVWLRVSCLSMFTASAHGYTHRIAASVLFVYVHPEFNQPLDDRRPALSSRVHHRTHVVPAPTPHDIYRTQTILPLNIATSNMTLRQRFHFFSTAVKNKVFSTYFSKILYCSAILVNCEKTTVYASNFQLPTIMGTEY